MNKFFEMIGEAFEEAMKSHEDLVIVIDGQERSGKSALARLIAYYLRDNHGANFDLKRNVYFTTTDIIIMFKQLEDPALTPPGTVHIIDEAQNIIHHRNTRSSINIYFDEALKSIGALRQVFIFCTPAFWELDVIHRRMDVLIHVFKRGKAGAWIPPRLWRFLAMTFDLKKRRKITNFNQILEYSRIPPTMMFKFGKPGDEREYNAIKNKHVRDFNGMIAENLMKKLEIKLNLVKSDEIDELIDKVMGGG